MKMIKSPDTNTSFSEGLDLLDDVITALYVSGNNMYVIDLINRQVVFVNINLIYRCGITVKGANGMRIEQFHKHVSEKDLSLIQAGLNEFFRFQLEEGGRKAGDHCMAVDFTVINPAKHEERMVNHKLSLLSVTAKGKPWHILGQARMSTHLESGYTRVIKPNSYDYWELDYEKRKWILTHGQELTKGEIDVLLKAAQGLTMEETAKCLGRSIDAIRTRRQNIFSKLKAKNIQHALQIACDMMLL